MVGSGLLFHLAKRNNTKMGGLAFLGLFCLLLPFVVVGVFLLVFETAREET